MTDRVRVQRQGPVTVLTVANPPLNLLDLAVRQELADRARALADDAGCRVVVLAGAGDRAFCAGSDVREFPATAEEGTARAVTEHACFEALVALRQPVVAALHGHVLGGGLELALCADLRVCDSDAVLGFPEVGLGLLPCGGGTQRLPRLVGPAHAKRLLFTGARISAEEAMRIGLVDQAAPPGRVLSVALATALRIAEQPRAAVQAIKTAVDRGLAEGIGRGVALEEELGGPLFATREAVDARAQLLARRTTGPRTSGSADHRSPRKAPA
jgi:enoyl-CoA hydratase/carnithine racemase